MNKTIPAMSADALTLVKYLKDHSTATYAELNKVIPGRNVRGKDRYVLGAAIKRLLNEHGIVILTVRGVGVKHAEDVEKTTLSESMRKQVYRKAKRCRRQMETVDYAKLETQDQKAAWNLGMTQARIVEHITAAPTTKRLETAVRTAQERLPVGRVLEVMK